MHVIVVGGGIGGAAAAVALSRAGIEVTLLEQAKVLSEVGAGIQIGSNGTRALRALGLLDAFRAKAVSAHSYRILDFESGELINDLPLGAIASRHFGDDAFEAHRADLMDIIVSALPEGVVHLNQRCMHVSENDGVVTVTLESGDTLTADAVIGADGIHSNVRKGMFGDQPAIPSGMVAWRSTISADKIEHLGFEERFYGWRGPNRIAIAYWLRPGKLFNFVAIVPASDLEVGESWSHKGDKQLLERSLSGCAPQLGELIKAVDDNFLSALNYRKPLERWTVGRVTLMGDAAHAMLPYMAQGAVQSLEDAVVLGRCLQRAREGRVSIEDALLDYEHRRRPRTTRVQTNVLALRDFWFASDPLKRAGNMRRMQAQGKLDPYGDSQWSWVYTYDAEKEADAPLGYPVMMPFSRARNQVIPPRFHPRQLWESMFGFDDRIHSNDGLRAAYERRFASSIPSRRSELNGMPCLETGTTAADAPVVLHVHGGCYVMGSAQASLGHAAALAEAAGARVVVVDYRLAPEHPYPAALEDVIVAYRGLLDAGVANSRIIFSGESSGGSLALAALMSLRDSATPLPAGLIATSPFADMCLSGESLLTNGFGDEFVNKDFLTVAATSYYQLQDPRHSCISPVFGDFTDLPPLLVQVAQDEAVASDAIRIVKHAKDAGTNARLTCYPTSTHAFVLFSGDEPCAGEAIAEAGEFIRAAVGELRSADANRDAVLHH
ncbi:alpha/beta hydrolase fold domain-containing protein [Pandoraea nosoerga]|uniref:Salicylate hydroxylase n=1 Tax=Pandoraea nosoerga TaxID=2508296 RepID=A0A5E4W089_9BURK|nr:alpha/beta hydrolase fold domain-containing protein [Pandoraea nosoerga]VVE18042.1 salicylate hydroxylase [Pandoraea nosoerga]